MCVMSTASLVGVRELRQNLSKYLDRVARGETLRVCERGRPVAVLAPLPEEAGVVERLRSQGRLLPARLDLAGLGPPPRRPGVSISETLRQERDER